MKIKFKKNKVRYKKVKIHYNFREIYKYIE